MGEEEQDREYGKKEGKLKLGRKYDDKNKNKIKVE